MTSPAPEPTDSRSPIGEGTDITVDASDLEPAEKPATSDPEQMNEDEALGGVGGGTPGGAG